MTVTEIAPDIYRISTYIPDLDLQFNQFLVKDEEPLLFHTGMKVLFPQVLEAVTSIIEPSHIRWIGFSHFEADECGSLNEWLQIAPAAQPVCSLVGAMVSVNDFAVRPAYGMKNNDVFSTGKYRFRFLQTPHLPHGWEAGHLFEETNKTLFCSDLFHQGGNVEPLTEGDVIDRSRKTLIDYQAGPFANYMPYTKETDSNLQNLANLQPRTIAAMHGSAFTGDGQQALLDLAVVIRDILS